MKRNHQISFLSLSDSELGVIEKPKNPFDFTLKNSEDSVKNQSNFLEKHMKSKLMMKVLSCEDLKKLNNTLELDKMMRKRKKNV